MKIPVNRTVLTAAMSAAAVIGVMAAVFYVNLDKPQQVEANSSPQFQSTCKLTTPLLIDGTKTKADHHKTSGRDDLHEMFMRSHLTFKGQDDYTVADIKARPESSRWTSPSTKNTMPSPSRTSPSGSTR